MKSGPSECLSTISKNLPSVNKLHKMPIVVPNHSSTLLANLAELRREHILCDVEICIGKDRFLAHKNVLTACSDYFRAMLAGSLSVQGDGTVTLKEVNPSIFESILDFIYSGSADVTHSNCQELLAAGDFFGLTGVIAACSEFLEQNLQPNNCIGIYIFAEAHGCDGLKKTTGEYIHRHFPDVVKDEEFLSVSKEFLCDLLRSENLQIECEFQVLKAAMAWIMHDVPTRRRWVFDVMAPVRFPVIPKHRIFAVFEICPDLSLKVALQKIVQDFQHSRKLSDNYRLKPHLMQPRKRARKHLYVIGGYTHREGGSWGDIHELQNVECYDTFLQTWRAIPSLCHSRSGHGAATIDGRLYVVGGENDMLIYDSVECFDPALNKWSIMPPLTMPRSGLGVCALGGSLFAFGGCVGSTIDDSVEMYDTDARSWTLVGKMSSERTGMGIVELEGLIFIVGGRNGFGVDLTLVESINPITMKPQTLANLRTPRAHVGVASLDGYIYAVGGWNEKHGTLDSVERYCPELDEWKDVSSMGIARAAPCVAAVNGSLFVIGGRTRQGENLPNRTLNSVEAYNAQADAWHPMECVQTSRCDAAVVVL